MKALDLSKISGTDEEKAEKINSSEIKVTLRYDENGKRCSKEKAKTERTLTAECITPNAEELTETEINDIYDSAFTELKGSSKDSDELIARRAIILLYSSKFRQEVRNTLLSAPKPKDSKQVSKVVESNIDNLDKEAIENLQKVLAAQLAKLQPTAEKSN